MFPDLMYLDSNSTLVLLASGMMKRFRHRDNTAMSVAAARYGTIILWKLTPQLRIATISESAAIFEVKKITVMNTNSGENILMK